MPRCRHVHLPRATRSGACSSGVALLCHTIVVVQLIPSHTVCSCACAPCADSFFIRSPSSVPFSSHNTSLVISFTPSSIDPPGLNYKSCLPDISSSLGGVPVRKVACWRSEEGASWHKGDSHVSRRAEFVNLLDWPGIQNRSTEAVKMQLLGEAGGIVLFLKCEDICARATRILLQRIHALITSAMVEYEHVCLARVALKDSMWVAELW
mmetsp:Transcript_31805/g.83132  ORF Transcript_31805/g.83132 Transcript_31805/m.83132 type:complete len:209 (-) Transcript_31805:137-763(-)